MITLDNHSVDNKQQKQSCNISELFHSGQSLLVCLLHCFNLCFFKYELIESHHLLFNYACLATTDATYPCECHIQVS